MSTIAITGIPVRWGLQNVRKILLKTKLKVGLELLNFGKPRGNFKSAYVNVSAIHDPLNVIQRINNVNVKGIKLTAIIPSHVPDLPLAKKVVEKREKKLENKKNRATGYTYEWILVRTHKELLEELMYKYMKLEDLSKKTRHKLLDEIAETLFRRLKQIMLTNEEASKSCFNLSKAYRKSHPHFADFQLILSTLHRVEDAAGAARTQLVESELKGVSTAQKAEDLPYKKVQQICGKYQERIIVKMNEYISGLETDGPAQSPEDEARIRVRTELKNLQLYLPLIIREIVSTAFAPDKRTFHRMRMYGEPYLPAVETLEPILAKRCGGGRVQRSLMLHNLVRFNVPLDRFAHAMGFDNNDIGAAKLVVRPSTTLSYSVRPELLAQMNVAFGTPVA